MPRIFAFAFLSFSIGTTLVGGIAVGCSRSLDDGSPPLPDGGGSGRRDGAPVDPTEGGDPVDAAWTVTPDCTKYCARVMTNCTGENAQYASVDECVGFCAHLPPSQPTQEAEEKAAATVACRQYWADSPAKTDPNRYCLAAGPFGGNVCGDRCTAYCGVVLATCTPDGSVPAYASQPECATACAAFTYRDAGTDGGGEDPSGPATGDTLNCRLFHLRAATRSADRCVALHPDGGACVR